MPGSSTESNPTQPPKVSVTADKAQVEFRIEDVVRLLLPELTASSGCQMCHHCSEASQITATAAESPEPYRFEIQLEQMSLDSGQVERIASAVRNATKLELLKMDFRAEEVRRLFTHGTAAVRGCSGCGGGCRTSSQEEFA